MMVLTNGVLCSDSRMEIKSIVSGVEMTYLGIGIGLYLCGFEDLFPTMIWNSNPAQLSETLMNMTDISLKGSPNAVPEQQIGKEIMNGTFEKTFAEMTLRICNILSIYEATLSSIRFDIGPNGWNNNKDIDIINDSKYDLGRDGAFGSYSILFIVLYLCRGEKDEQGKVIDEFITDEVLKYGKEVKGNRFSPVAKLGKTIINDIHIGKGFEIGYAYDYKKAIKELSSGKYRMAFITCSPGDGIMAKECDKDVDQYADNFVYCVHEFNKRGGGVFWFLENYPFTYEADLYFKKYYGFEAVGDKTKNIKGGKVMTRTNSEIPKAGQFITVGGNAKDLSNLSRLDYGIERIFEGRTLCLLNEEKLVKKGFRIFAKESEGHASIFVKEKQEEKDEGRMIIDTAASKLFLEFTEDGTARWISNAAVWLCNTEKCEEERFLDPSVKSGIIMDRLRFPGLKPMEKREIMRQQQKHVNFCLSVVMDTTGSMSSYINATRDNIVQILNKLKQIEKEHHLPEGGIVGQVVQYKNFHDTFCGDTAEYITNDFNRLKSKLASFRTSGGGDGCGDVQGGLLRALEQMKQSPYNSYNHLILIVGDYAYHGDTPGCTVDKYVNGKSIYTVWEEIYRDIKSFKGIRVMFMPVSVAEIRLTMKRMQSALGPNIVDSAEVTTETNFVEVVTKTTISEYKRFIGIS